MTGRLYGVGVGPGDPELVTLKAARLIRDADVVAYHSGTAGRSIARTIVADLISPDATEELLIYPVTTGATAHPLGYYGAIEDFYDESAERLGKHLDAGRTVVVLAEGDPLFYSSYSYLHDRLAPLYPAEIVPGVTSVSASAAAVTLPISRHEDTFTVLPGTMAVPELARRLADGGGAAIMKLGRTFEGVREALRQAGRLDDAWYVERASTGRERRLPVTEVDPDEVPYFSMVLVPGPDLRADAAQRALSGAATTAGADSPVGVATGRLLVVGLGPGPERWVTPEVTAALAEVDHVVGYGPYVDRVPQRPGLQRHATGNTVEVDRASFALELARRGERVAVVSGGDAGVFGMASAVFEAVGTDDRFADVAVEVLPGLTAAQAVAARAGAPLGGDYAVVSLSDRLKPWELVERRLHAVGAADLALALYNPASRARPDGLGRAREALLRHRDPATPVVLARDVGGPGERVIVTSLGELDPGAADMRTVVLVGSSTTRRVPRPGGGELVYTPRRYPA